MSRDFPRPGWNCSMFMCVFIVVGVKPVVHAVSQPISPGSVCSSNFGKGLKGTFFGFSIPLPVVPSPVLPRGAEPSCLPRELMTLLGS